MSTITDGWTTITPVAVSSPYETSQPSRNVFHDVIGRAAPDVSLAPASPRQGTLTLGFDDSNVAESARLLLSTPAMFTYVDDTIDTLGMRFAVDGMITTRYDADDQLWTLDFSYREVPQ